MLKVTEAACQLLSEMLLELQTTEGKVVRIVASGAGHSLLVGEVHADDRVFRHETKAVLAVAEGVTEDGQDLTLDVVVTIRGPDLRVTVDDSRPQPNSRAAASA